MEALLLFGLLSSSNGTLNVPQSILFVDRLYHLMNKTNLFSQKILDNISSILLAIIMDHEFYATSRGYFSKCLKKKERFMESEKLTFLKAYQLTFSTLQNICHSNAF